MVEKSVKSGAMLIVHDCLNSQEFNSMFGAQCQIGCYSVDKNSYVSWFTGEKIPGSYVPLYTKCGISRVERKTSVSQMVVFPQT